MKTIKERKNLVYASSLVMLLTTSVSMQANIAATSEFASRLPAAANSGSSAVLAGSSNRKIISVNGQYFQWERSNEDANRVVLTALNAKVGEIKDSDGKMTSQITFEACTTECKKRILELPKGVSEGADISEAVKKAYDEDSKKSAKPAPQEVAKADSSKEKSEPRKPEEVNKSAERQEREARKEEEARQRKEMESLARKVIDENKNDMSDLADAYLNFVADSDCKVFGKICDKLSLDVAERLKAKLRQSLSLTGSRGSRELQDEGTRRALALLMVSPELSDAQRKLFATVKNSFILDSADITVNRVTSNNAKLTELRESLRLAQMNNQNDPVSVSIYSQQIAQIEQENRILKNFSGTGMGQISPVVSNMRAFDQIFTNTLSELYSGAEGDKSDLLLDLKEQQFANHSNDQQILNCLAGTQAVCTRIGMQVPQDFFQNGTNPLNNGGTPGQVTGQRMAPNNGGMAPVSVTPGFNNGVTPGPMLNWGQLQQGVNNLFPVRMATQSQPGIMNRF